MRATSRNHRRYGKGAYMRLKSGALLAEMLKARRKEHPDTSQEDLAEFADVSQPFISQLVHEVRKTCRPGTARRIAAYFDVPVTVLFVEGPVSRKPRDVGLSPSRRVANSVGAGCDDPAA